MALTFHPEPGTVLMCDFNTGFRPPEMVKVRPVVVLSPRRRRWYGLATVVPLSTTPPVPVEPVHHRLDPASLPGRLSARETWAKCDMLYTVSLERLDRVRIGKEPSGRRLYVAERITASDLAAIQRCVEIALGLDRRRD
jgi:uncharacterized protein YifN (PemK superfamily)